jgi:prepilin-type N-terminal cleavage/methylation domain-containing protein
MLTRSARGFTLAEVAVALVLTGIVSTAIYELLVNNQRIYRQQTQRIELNDNVRSAMAILPSELRGLDAADPRGSDIIEMTDTSVAYKAVRVLRWTCPNLQTGTQLYLDTTVYALRGIDPTYDSVLIFADSNPMRREDDHWYHADVTSAPQSGSGCPNGAVKINVALGLQRMTNANQLVARDDVLMGSPVMAFELVRMMSYQDVYGDTWLGVQRYGKSTGWSALQPVVGPLVRGGLKFTYYDATGAVTTNRSQVARIRVTVIGRTSQMVKLTTGSMGYLLDSLNTQVALRNNNR